MRSQPPPKRRRASLPATLHRWLTDRSGFPGGGRRHSPIVSPGLQTLENRALAGRVAFPGVPAVRKTLDKAFRFSLTQTQGFDHLARMRLRADLGS